MIAYVWVGIGSALGGMARYGISLLSVRLWGAAFPWGTLIINVLGSFVIGFFGTLTLPDGILPASPSLRVFVMVGICGGFTTFSSFSLQTLDLARGGNWFGAFGNVMLSVALCLAAVAVGHGTADRLGVLQPQAASLPPRIIALLRRPETAPAVLAAAALAADRLGDARIEALHIRPDPAGLMPTEDVSMPDDAAARLHAIFETWNRSSGQGTWNVGDGETGRLLGQLGASLVVLGRAGTDAAARGDLQAALFEAEAPTLLVPDSVTTVLGRHIAVAWRPSPAAERAVAIALPLLRRAERITVLIGSEAGDATPAELPRSLPTSPVATVHRFAVDGRGSGTALLAAARGKGADLLVMGAYSHGRLPELILGGATRDVLEDADIPVLLRV